MLTIVEVTRISTRQTGGQHPHKAHKKLIPAEGKLWLKINGHMTKPKGKPPYKFLYRKKIRQSKKGKPKRKGKSKSMSAAAKKAWKTRRARGH